ncbi:MAG: hypothetical protein ACI4QE_01785, partial [Acutalibacteraceae bacterium]
IKNIFLVVIIASLTVLLFIGGYLLAKRYEHTITSTYDKYYTEYHSEAESAVNKVVEKVEENIEMAKEEEKLGDRIKNKSR